MADQLQLRGGTTTEHNNFTGASKEVTVDTTKHTLVVHNNTQAGGFPLMRESGSNEAATVGIGTGGTTAIHIDNSQKIGIGTLSPQVLMHLHDTNARMQFTDSSTGSGSGDGVIAGLNGDDDFFINNRESNKNIKFFTGGSESLHIDSNGDVGIGTSSPDGLLHIKNNNAFDTKVIIESSGTDSYPTYVLKNDARQYSLQINGDNDSLRVYDSTGTEERITLNKDGRVGIGDTNPSSAQLVVYRQTVNNDNPIIQARSNHSATKALKFEIDGNGDAFFSSKVGIGTEDPGNFNTNANDIVIDRAGNAGITISTGSAAVGRLAFGDPDDNNRGQIRYTHSDDNMIFDVNGSERMSIDSNGTIYLSSNNDPTGGGSATLYVSGSQMQAFRGNQGDYIIFKTTSNTQVGSIRNNGNTGVQYNVTSDYRLKENQTAISDGITRLKTLKPYRFNWKSDSSRIVDGFFAHEVTAVPEAISGTKDAIAVQEDVDEGRATNVGDPVYQSIDHSKLVPLLTAALQEAISKIETLETKVAALEAK